MKHIIHTISLQTTRVSTELARQIGRAELSPEDYLYLIESQSRVIIVLVFFCKIFVIVSNAHGVL